MTEQEAQQARTIEIQKYSAAKRDIMCDDHGWLVRYEDHKRIVDSQAQKIDHQQAEINVKTIMLNDMNEIYTEQSQTITKKAAYAIGLQGKIAEQEKQIELMALGTRSRESEIDKLRNKIAEQAKEIERLKNGKTIGSLHHQIATLEVKIAEQAKEIESLKDEIAEMRVTVGLPW
jgi:uncharacterized coiled-coil protein SlyX